MGPNLPRLNNGSLFSDFPAIREDLFFPIEQHFNQVFNEFFGKGALNSVVAKSGYPKMDVGIEGNQFVVRAAMPGLEVEDVHVEITPDRILRVSGQMAEEFQSPEGPGKYWAKELRKSAFLRKVALPQDLEGDPQATMKAGILTLAWDLPRKEEVKPKTKLIEVKPG